MLHEAQTKASNKAKDKDISGIETKEKHDSQAKIEYSSEHVNPSAFYEEGLIVKVWEAHIQAKKLKYYYCTEDEPETIVETLFTNKDSVSLSKNAGLLVNPDGSLYKRKDVKTGLTSSVSICNLVNHRLGSRPGFNAISFNIKIALEQVIRWNKDKKKEPIHSHVIIFPYHATEVHWNLGVLAIDFDVLGLVDFAVKAFDPYGGGSINKVVVETLEKLCAELFKNLRNFKYSPQTNEEHPKQQNDGAACGPITGEDGKDVIDGTVERLAKSYPPGASDLRLQHLTEVHCKSFYKSQWLDERQYTDGATKGDKDIDDKKTVIKGLVTLINGLSEEVRKEFLEAFEVLAQICKEEKGRFVQGLSALRNKEILNELTEEEKLQIARLCLDKDYVKHKLEELILDPYKWPIRKLKALILSHKEAFEQAKIFNIIIVAGSTFADGAIALLEEVADKERFKIKVKEPKKHVKGKDKEPQVKSSENIALFSSYAGFVSALSSVEVYEDKDGEFIFGSAAKDDMERFRERLTMEWMDDTNGLGKYLNKTQDLTNMLLDIKVNEVASKDGLSFCYSIPTKLVKIMLDAINKFYSELERQRREKEGLSAARNLSLVGRGKHAAAGLKNTLHGNIYQLKLLMLFLKVGVEKKYSFKLATELAEAEKFDDLVFKFTTTKSKGKDNKVVWKYRYLQAKHRLDEDGKIKDGDLLTEQDSDFSLQKYFISYCSIKKKFTDGSLKDFTICTNINFDFEGDSDPNRILKLKNAFNTLEADDVLNVGGKKKAIRYCFKKDFPGRDQIVAVLRDTSDLTRLANALIEYVFEKKKLDLRNPLFKAYHVALAEEVLDVGEGKFFDSFVKNKKSLSKNTREFRVAFIKCALKHIKKKRKQDFDEQVLCQEIGKIKLEFSKTFGQEDTDAKPELPADNVSDEDINGFLNRLVFAVDQPNEVELGDIITEAIGKEFNLIDSDFIASQFQKEMLDWMKHKQGRFLSHKDGEQFFTQARHGIDRLILLGPTVEYGVRLEKLKIAFAPLMSLQAFLNPDNENRILYFVAEKASYTYVSSIKVYQTLKVMKAYQKDGSYVFVNLSYALNMIERLKNAFSAKECNLLVLILDVTDKKLEDLMGILQGVLEKNPNKRIIIVTPKEKSIPTLKSTIKHVEIPDTNSGFSDLTLGTQTALKERGVLFQGQRCTFAELTHDGNIQALVNAETLSALVAEEEVVVGCMPSYLNDFEASCYIDRTIKVKRIVSNKCLKENNSDLFLITEMDREGLTGLLPKNERVRRFDEEESNTKDPTRYIFWEQSSDQKSHLEKFHALSRSYPKYSIHWLHFKDNNLIWSRSHGSLTKLVAYMEEEVLGENEFIKANDRVAVVAAEPGMGKSSLVTRLVEKTKKFNPNLWVIRIDLIVYREQISGSSFNTKEDAIDFLAITQQLTTFAKNLLMCRMNIKDQIQLFLDGFDEISNEQQTKVIKFLRFFKNVKIFVTTRLHKKVELENTLGVFACALEPFSESDKRRFLLNFWRKHLNISEEDQNSIDRLMKYARKLLKAFASSTQDTNLDFMGIPLQARLLAEAFLEDVEKFYRSEEEPPEVPKDISLTTLYERFVSNKYAIYFRDKIKAGVNLHQGLISSLEVSLTKAHQRQAFIILFPEHFREFFESKGKTSFTVDELRSVGIIQSVEEVPNFVHRTFAEYLVAEYFVKKLKKTTDHSSFQKTRQFLLVHIFKPRNHVIRTFIEHRVEKEQNTELSRVWQEICACDVLKTEPGTLKFVETVRLSEERNLTEEQDASDNTPEEPEEDFALFLEKLDQFKSRSTSSKVYEFFPDFFKAFFHVFKIDQLEKALEKLIFIARKTNFNILKREILEKVNEIVNYYLDQCISQPDAKIRRELLEGFEDVKPYQSGTELGERVGSSVAYQLEAYEKNLKVYMELAELIEHPPKITTSFLEGLTLAKILFLRKRNTRFNRDGVDVLKKLYNKWNENEHFKELFLQINKKEADYAKKFLIAKREFELLIKLASEFEGLVLSEEEVDDIKEFLLNDEDAEEENVSLDKRYKLLIKLYAKFPNLRLNRNEAEKVYNSKKDDLLWLERDGILFFDTFEILTGEIVTVFNTILDARRINGYHTRYAANILRDLIFPILEKMEMKPLADVNRVEFIRMVNHFLRFASLHELNVSLNLKQLKIILNQVKKLLDLPIISSQMFSCVVQAMVNIPTVFGFKLINFEDKLMLVNPRNDFYFELSVNHKPLLLKWIAVYEKDRVAFGEEIANVTEEMLAGSLQGLSAALPKAEPGAISGMHRSLSHNDLHTMTFSYKSALKDDPLGGSKTLAVQSKLRSGA